MDSWFSAVVASALVVAMRAVFFVYRQLGKIVLCAARLRAPRVLVAARDLPIGTPLKSEVLRAGVWSGAPPGRTLVESEDAIENGVAGNICGGEALSPKRVRPLVCSFDIPRGRTSFTSFGPRSRYVGAAFVLP
jgi:pilus assembly protein CpaB